MILRLFSLSSRSREGIVPPRDFEGGLAPSVIIGVGETLQEPPVACAKDGQKLGRLSRNVEHRRFCRLHGCEPRIEIGGDEAEERVRGLAGQRYQYGPAVEQRFLSAIGRDVSGEHDRFVQNRNCRALCNCVEFAQFNRAKPGYEVSKAPSFFEQAFAREPGHGLANRRWTELAGFRATGDRDMLAFWPVTFT